MKRSGGTIPQFNTVRKLFAADYDVWAEMLDLTCLEQINYMDLWDLYMPLAEAGDTEVRLQIGLMDLHGNPVGKSFQEAWRFFRDGGWRYK